MSYIAEIEARVAGIPCLIGVTSWWPYVPARTYGPPEDCYPEEGGYGDWEVLDRRGRPAPWLSKKLCSRDEQAIEELLFEHFDNQEYEP
jgi:hypothetical protein